METEQSFQAPSGPLLRSEPFRFFFPLGVVLSWFGVGHWLFYALGFTATYSCEVHGLIQTEAFLMAFAVGFLLTALPRRTRSSPPTYLEMAIITAGLLLTTIGSSIESWRAAQLGYVVIFAVLVQFAVRRFFGAGAARRPPAAFVLIPIAILQGLAGALLISMQGEPALWTVALGKLLVEQGVFLCLVMGVGSLILPLMSGLPPPPDLGSSPLETRKAVLYAGAGVAVVISLALEQAGWEKIGPILRAVIFVAGLAIGGRPLRPPGKPGLHRRLVWLSTWMIPLGLVASAFYPDLRVAALHITFIGGFGLIAFGVATHVSLSHLGMEKLALGRPWPVVVLALTFLMVLTARLAADLTDAYFEHLGWAAALWLAGTAAWLAFFTPAFVRRPSPP